jgi:anthranilate synthase/aminodeoxychorismate synthase-like glutamine amidotransferase
MLLIVDHRDSFTWNLVHALAAAGPTVQVVDAAAASLEFVRACKPRGLILSPGPGHPREAQATVGLVRALAGELPILGVCLGHQVICAAWGAQIVHARHVCHGRVSWVTHDGSALFADIPSPFRAARYHSLAVEPASLPHELVATAWADSGELMAVQHAALPLWSVQFHPESFLTEHGARLVRNFVHSLGPIRQQREERLES